MSKKKKFLILTFSLLLFQFFAFGAYALEVIYPPVPGAETPQSFMKKIEEGQTGYRSEDALPLYIKYFYHLLVTVSGLACVIAIIVGGISLSLSSVYGSAPRAKDALERISAGILGIIIVLFSYGILMIVDPNLLVFDVTKDKIKEPVMPDIPETKEEGAQTYIEIPYAGLIEVTKEQAAIVESEAVDVWLLTSVKGVEGQATITETSMCLKVLLEHCDCTIEDTENCYIPDPSASSTGSCKNYRNCEEEVDPCDISGSVEVGGETIRISDLCDITAYNDKSHLTFDEISLDDTLVFGDLGTNNLREAIDKMKAQLDSLQEQAYTELSELQFAHQKLDEKQNRLKIAETLIRDVDPVNTPLNRDSYLAEKHTLEELGEDVETKAIWPYEGAEEATALKPDPDVVPSNPCQGECKEQSTPSCQYCEGGNVLLCNGNNYRCCPTDRIANTLLGKGETKCDPPFYDKSCVGHENETACTDPPPIYEQPVNNFEFAPGYCCDYSENFGCDTPDPSKRCCPPRKQEPEHVWLDATELPGVITYNGINFTVPNGGVHFFGSNDVNCSAIK